MPQDAVQQYVSQYAGSYIPQAPYNNAYDPGNFIPSLPIKLHKIIKFAEYFYRKNRCTKRDLKKTLCFFQLPMRCRQVMKAF